jgi:hypothetical protein
VGACRVELTLLEVHPSEHDAGKSVTQDPQHRAHPAADLE